MQGQSPEAAIHLAHHDHYSDRLLRMILRNVRTFAMVGASTVWRRPSFYAMKYLQKRGFRVIPVNPARAGEEILGEIVYATIKDVPVQLDMVDNLMNRERNHAALAQLEAKPMETVDHWVRYGQLQASTGHLGEAETIFQGLVDRCGTGRSQTFNDVADAVIDWYGRGEKRYIEFPQSLVGRYQSFTQASVDALREAGYGPAFATVGEGVARYLDWLADHGEADKHAGQAE